MTRTVQPRPRATAPPLGPPGAGAAEGMPPVVLVLTHFALGLGWLLLGATGLVIIAPTLAAGGVLNPRTIAVAHMFTLGVIVTVIVGSLYQLFPVVLGVSLRSVRVAWQTLVLLLAGTVAMVLGAWTWTPVALATGWVLLFGAVFGMAWNLLPQRRKASRGRLIGLFVSGAHMGLGLAMGVVLVRIGAELGWWRVSRLGLLSAHAHLAVVGFGTLTAFGVGSKLLPMFLLSRDHTDRFLPAIGVGAFGGLLVHATGSIAYLPSLTWAGGLAMAAAVATWLAVMTSYVRRRSRRVLDAPMVTTIVAAAHLGLATVVGVLLLVRGFDARLAAAYGVLGVLGWLVLLIAGMALRIVPFLTWMYRFGPRMGQGSLPTVAQLTVPALGWIALVLLALGTLGLAAAVAIGTPAGARLGAVVFAGGAVVTALQYGRLARMSWRD